MIFVREASAYTDEAPISLKTAHQAVQQSVRTFSTAIPEHHWEKLAKLDSSPDQKIPNGDPDYLEMLDNVSVLEHINGDDESNPFTSSEPWYTVNPIVRELLKFTEAATALSKVSKP